MERPSNLVADRGQRLSKLPVGLALLAVHNYQLDAELHYQCNDLAIVRSGVAVSYNLHYGLRSYFKFVADQEASGHIPRLVGDFEAQCVVSNHTSQRGYRNSLRKTFGATIPK